MEGLHRQLRNPTTSKDIQMPRVGVMLYQPKENRQLCIRVESPVTHKQSSFINSSLVHTGISIQECGIPHQCIIVGSSPLVLCANPIPPPPRRTMIFIAILDYLSTPKGSGILLPEAHNRVRPLQTTGYTAHAPGTETKGSNAKAEHNRCPLPP